MDIFSAMRGLVVESIERMQADGALAQQLDLDALAVEPPRDAAHGDMATNAAMVLTGQVGEPPRDLAGRIAERLAADARIERAVVAGPGFINLTLSRNVWHDVLHAAIAQGAEYGRGRIGAGLRANVEYVSANPTGPLHVGHARGAIFGDALASLLAHVGYEVTREYYVNDGGAQVDALARSVYLRYLQAHGREAQFKEGDYPGDYLVEVGEALKREVGDAFLDSPESEWLERVRIFATDAMMALVRADLEAIGVRMDVFFSERSLYGTGRIEEAIAALDARGLIYEGVLEPPKGKLPEDWEPREQTLFRSTAHGDDTDRPIKRSDGGWTYFAPDIAYHYDKVARGYDVLIDVFGADHGGYVKRIKATVSALSDGKTSLDVLLTQLVRLFKDGKPFKMSKRGGRYVTLRDLVDGVGAGAARFVMLTRKNDAQLDFDFDKALAQSSENPVFYVQYAHARIASVLRKARELGIAAEDSDLAAADLSGLVHESEVALARKVAEWPRRVEIAARAREPHRITYYLGELASEFHSLWNLGNAEPSLRFIQEDDAAATQAKLALARAVMVAISNGLGILGVVPAEEMR